MMNIGAIDPHDAVQTTKGLEVRGRLDVKDNPVAKQVHRLMRERRLKGWSFGYTVPDGGEKMTEDGVNEISQIALVETGPTLKGANPEAELQAVKSLKTMAEVEQAALNAEIEPSKKGPVREAKSAWSTNYINDLPDSAFLFVDTSGERDNEGKTTPRSLRHFPVRNKSGDIDIPHLRNALSRIPQSTLPSDAKSRLTAMAQRLLDRATTEGVDTSFDEEEAELKAAEGITWDQDFIDMLPDSAFLYVEPGGTKDAESKTVPRAHRHFAFKDSEGNVDRAHLEHQLNRIPHSNLPQDVKNHSMIRARRILDGLKAAALSPEEVEANLGPEKRDPDPLRRQVDRVLLDLALDR
jgi:hypothetical protein